MSGTVAIVERLLPARCAVVYDQWLDAESLLDWMCPAPARLQRVALDPVVGGAYRFEIVENGKEIVVEGRFLTLERPHTIRFTWNCSTWPPSYTDSIVTVELQGVEASSTHITVHHELVPPGTVTAHAAGWDLVAGQLAGWQAKRRRAW